MCSGGKMERLGEGGSQEAGFRVQKAGFRAAAPNNEQ